MTHKQTLKTLSSYISSIPQEDLKTDKNILTALYPCLEGSLNLVAEKEIEACIDMIVSQIHQIFETKPYITSMLQQETPENILSTLSRHNFLPPLGDIFGSMQNLTPDIPVQNKQAQEAGVPKEYNATVGMLLDEKGEVIVSPEVEKSLLSYDISSKSISPTVTYHPGEGKKLFRNSISELIREEEKRYDWINSHTKKRKGVALDPFFIPGGAGGLTIARDYFLQAGDLAIVPNKRWPNIDGILFQVTKVPPAVTNIYDDRGNIDFENLDLILQTAQKQERKTALIYINPVSNPTGTIFSPDDSKKLNSILQKYKKLEITLVIDDPYGVFSVTGKSIEGKNKVSIPLAYYINTHVHVTILEMGSRGTKEGGVYGLRSAVMRVFTSQEKAEEMDVQIKRAIRQTFSMSPSFPQDIYIQALFDEHDFQQIESMPDEEKSKRIQKYLDGRDNLIDEVQKRRKSLSKNIQNSCSAYLSEIKNISEGSEYTGGFFIGYTLSEQLQNMQITAEDIRKSCISLGVDGCAITVVNDVVRIVLAPTKYHEEFSVRLKHAIEICISK